MAQQKRRLRRSRFFGPDIEQFASAAFIYDNHFKIAGLNRAAQDLLQLTTKDVLGLPCQEVFHCGCCDSSCILLSGLFSDSAEGTIQIGSASGGKAVLRTLRLADSAGITKGSVAVVTSFVEATSVDEILPLRCGPQACNRENACALGPSPSERTTCLASNGISSYHFSDVTVDFVEGFVAKRGSIYSLGTKESMLLRYLVDQGGNIVSRDELLQNVWKYDSEVISRTVDVHVSWLRQKVEDNPHVPKHILTVRGVGYRFTP